MHGRLSQTARLAWYRLLIMGGLLLIAAAWVLTLLGFAPELVATVGVSGRSLAGGAGAVRLLATPSRRWFSTANLVIVVGLMLLATGGAGRLLGFAPIIPEPGDTNPLPPADLLIVLVMALAAPRSPTDK